MSGVEALLVDVPPWWEEGDRALGTALVASKATEIRLLMSVRRHPADEALGKLYARAKERVKSLEQAIREWRKVHMGEEVGRV
jgi:hypothetical protein